MQPIPIPDIATSRLTLGLISASLFGPLVFSIVFSLVVSISETGWVLLFLLYTRGYADVFQIFIRAIMIGAPLTLVLGFVAHKVLARYQLYSWRIYALAGVPPPALAGFFFFWVPMFAPKNSPRSWVDFEVAADIAIFLLPFGVTGLSIATLFWWIAIRPALKSRSATDIEGKFS